MRRVIWRILIFLSLGLMVFQLPTTNLSSGLNIDTDESGYCPTTMDCDGSAEASICLDFSDDIAQKKIWVASNELQNSDGVYIYIYGLASNTYNPNINSHCVYINGVLGSTFNAHNSFSTTRWGWHILWLDPNLFYGDIWNYITIKDSSAFGVEDLYIGIDLSFPGDGYEKAIYDFDRSQWSNDYPNEFPPPDELQGELMIRTYIYNDQFRSNEHDNERNDGVYMDDTYDHCEKLITITQADLNAASRFQLYIWGYAWGNSELNNNNLYIEINGNRYYFNAYDIFKENCWDWGVFDGFTSEALVVGVNHFYFADNRATFDRENIAIGIDTDTTNLDHSRWEYNDGQGWHGTDNFQTDQGELMISLALFEKEYTCNKETSTTGIENYNDPGTPTLHNDDAYYFRDLYNAHNWVAAQDEYNGDVLEGDFYLEARYNTQLFSGADIADLVYHTGNAARTQILLLNSDIFNNQPDPYDQNYFLNYPPADVPNYMLEADMSSDGLDKDTEWVWYACCNVLRGYNTPTSADNPFQTLLYHGAHYLFGYYDTAPEDGPVWLLPDDYLCVILFHQYSIHLGYDVAQSYILANEANPIFNYHWCYYYHLCYEYDYLWGVGSGPVKWDTYEHNDIVFSYCT